jgi:hypothetical protein
MQRSTVYRHLDLARLLLASLVAGALHTAHAQTATASDPKPVSASDAKVAEVNKEGALVLTPFTVDTTKDKGYYAENTLAGSRLNSNLSDLAASITVVTKQQMADTASLDINDVFRYEANTEGSGSFTPSVTDRGTAKDTIAGYSLGNDGGTTTNAQSNRVRGLNAPDSAINYFPTNSRIPFDAYNTQSIEIARGPNSILSGLGSPSGIVNQTSAQAILNRNTNEVVVRTDQYGSYRASLSLNRSLWKDKLAVYGAFLYNNQQFSRKPSYELTRRQYGALTYKPFKNTIIRGFVENYLNNANRPNSIAPRDFVTPWLQAGRPSYDPIARTITKLDGGQTYGPYTLSTLSPGYNPLVPASAAALTATTSPFYVQGIGFDNISRPLQRIDDGQLVDFFQRQPVLYAPAQTNPATATPTAASLGWVPQDPRYAILDRQWTTSTNLPVPTSTVGGKTYTYGSYQLPGTTNAAIYDWRKYNINQANFGRVHATNYNLEIEQQILPNLFFNAGWLRQDIDSAENYTISQLTGATLQIDTNTKLPNGATNPYFGKVYVSDSTPDTFYQPETDDNYRAMLAYDLDLTKQSNLLRFLGKHRILGLWSEQDVIGKVERWRMAFVDGDADGKLRYLPNPTLNNGYNLWNDHAFARNYYLAKPGDPQAKVTQSSGFYGNRGWNAPFNAGIDVYNYNTGSFQKDQLSILSTFADNGSYTRQRQVESRTFAVQSNLLGDRLITTLGWRHDAYRARRTTTGAISRADGTVVAPGLNAVDVFHTYNGQADYDLVMNRWNRWDKLSGDTKTLGAAFRPIKNWRGADKFGELGSEFLQSFTLYYNESSNFNPPSAFQTDYFGKPLPKPTGEGKDGGFGFNLFGNKLVARVNWFTVENQNERTSAAGTLLTRLAYGDTTLMLPWAQSVVRIRHGANTQVSGWNTDTVNPLTSTALTQEVWDLLKLPVNYYAGTSAAGTQNSKAKGIELQMTYNPLPNWTIKVTGAKQETLYTKVAPEYDAWLAVRKPVWDAAKAADIPDFTDGAGTQYSLNNFQTSYGYSSAARASNTDGNTNAQNYFNNTVVSQVALAKALEGVVAATQRKYRGSMLTNYAFARGKLKGFSVGGSERWESKAALGYLGRVGDPTNPLNINVSDPSKPVYDQGNFYTDLWIGYSRKIFNNRYGWKLQLNVNNVTEDGHLQPTAVNFDGTPWAFRIIDSRQFILTSTFTF